MKNRRFIRFALTACVFFAFNSMMAQGRRSAVESTAGAIQIINRGARSLTLAFTPKGYSVYSQQVNGEELSSISFSGATYLDEPGKPQIPYYVAILGIPVGATVQFEILETDAELVSETKLLPHPSPRKVDGWPEPEFVLDTKTYGSAEPFPASLVSVQKPAFFREQQIARIRVAGIQFLPLTSQVKKYNRI
ncbi:MAG: C25 family peptidase propeptide domain-containing protein, partial [bacterium]